MMNWIDVLIIGIILCSTVLSLLRGFIKELLSLASWITAFFVASTYYPYVDPYLHSITNDQLRFFISVAVIFFVTLIVCSIVAHVLSDIIVQNAVSSIDRILGAAFGVARGIFIVVAILFLVERLLPNFVEDDAFQQSVSIQHFQVLLDYFFQFLNKATSEMDLDNLPNLSL